MPTPSKFNEETHQRILDALRLGCSRRTAAALAQVDHKTLSRWLARGAEAGPGTRWHQFALEVGEAEAAPKARALGIIYREMPDRPDLAWKFIERREPGFERPVPGAPPMIGAENMVVQLQFHDGTPLEWPPGSGGPRPGLIEGPDVGAPEDGDDDGP